MSFHTVSPEEIATLKSDGTIRGTLKKFKVFENIVFEYT